MKTMILSLTGLMLSSLFVSCDKSSEADVELLQDMLESNPTKYTLQIGMEYQGGIIFYLDASGKHGLVAAKEDLGPAPWGCFGTAVTGARSYEDGFANTQAFLEACNEPGTAARLCHQYEVKDDAKNGQTYSDWFMPSAIQFNELVNSLGAEGFCGKTYWSSTEEPAGFMAAPVNLAEQVNQHTVSCAVSDPGVYGFFRSPGSKKILHYVRPVRAF